MSKTIYHYDPMTGDFTGSDMARESPMEPGVYLVPANATTEAPPACGDNQRPVFWNSGWIIEDIPHPVQEPAPEPTQAEIIAQYERALDAHLDATAQAHRYDNRFTFALRSGYTGPYQADGKAFGTWMDDCNAQAYALLKDVVDGKKTMPTINDFIAGLPPFALP